MTYDDPTTWRLTTDGGIPYRIIDQSGSFEEENASATVTFLVPASQLIAFAMEVLPTSYTFQGFPVYPARSRIPGTPLQATKISWRAHIDGVPVDPFGFDSNAPDGTYQPNVEVTVEFSTIKYDGESPESSPGDPFTFLEVSANTSGEFIHTTAPKGEWAEDSETSETTKNKLSSTPVTILVPMTEWSVRWPQVPHVFYRDTLVTKLRMSLGRVNSVDMPLFFNAPPETILFVGYSLRQQFTWRSGTQPPFQLDMKFLEKYVYDNGQIRGHNHFWKPDEGWKYLRIDGTNPVYKQMDLNWLFEI